MAKTGPKNAPVRKNPQRRCVGCGGTFDKRELIRVVRAPVPETDAPVPETAAGEAERISVDRTGRKAGRGAYLCHNPACLAKARKSGRLAAALRCEITDTVYAALEKELETP